jgi:hypothetical protein
MVSVLWLAFGSRLRIFRNRRDLIFENFVLRPQLTVLKRRRPRPALNLFDKLFWVAVRRLWGLDGNRTYGAGDQNRSCTSKWAASQERMQALESPSLYDQVAHRETASRFEF